MVTMRPSYSLGLFFLYLSYSSSLMVSERVDVNISDPESTEVDYLSDSTIEVFVGDARTCDVLAITEAEWLAACIEHTPWCCEGGPPAPRRPAAPHTHAEADLVDCRL